MRQATPGSERTAAPREYSASSAPGPSVAIAAAICGAEILGLAGFSIVPALLPQFIEAWSLTNTQAGLLGGITSAGYMRARGNRVLLSQPHRATYPRRDTARADDRSRR